MDLGLKGKKALVTGATKGIGRRIADLLADEGCDVAVCARKADEVEETVGALAAKGVRATGGALDLPNGDAPWLLLLGVFTVWSALGSTLLFPMVTEQ